MTSESDLERRVCRVESETVAIYDELAELRTDMRAGFAQTQAGFTETRQRFDRVEDTLKDVLKRLPEPT